VSLVAIPEAVPSTLIGLHDALSSAGIVAGADPAAGRAPFSVRIVGEASGPVRLATGVPVEVERPIDATSSTDIVLVPSLIPERGRWEVGRHPGLVDWIERMHRGGALVVSACSGLFVIAETGLFDDREATIHYDYAADFRALFPRIALHPEKVLVVTGDRSDLISSGASTSWHDLALYLIARHAGATTAQAIARFYAFQWHRDGLAPYAVFAPSLDHGDAVIADVQRWIATHHAIAAPVEEMRARSGLAARTFVRRFSSATGYPPIHYVQRLRLEEAKRRLERTDTAVEQVAWAVGYEDPAAFRRLFRRTVGLTPGEYRRRFQVPPYARPSDPRRTSGAP
jgi:transcriptional regulator GlxA family with amidase domain